MNEETYKALKRLVDYCKVLHASNVNEDIKIVEDWIEEVVKEYE
jgi:hypothetical protein